MSPVHTLLDSCQSGFSEDAAEENEKDKDERERCSLGLCLDLGLPSPRLRRVTVRYLST